MSRLISQPLALHALQQNLGALGIVNAVRGAVGIAEIELGQVTVQMVMPAVLVNTFHAALENRKETFNGVGMNGLIEVVNVAANAVNGGAVVAKEPTNAAVLSGLISHDAGALVDVGLNDREQGFEFQVIHDNATGTASAAINQGEHFVLVGIASRILAFFLSHADKGFINFHGAATRAKGIQSAVLHGLTNAVRHEPSRLEGNAKGAVQLVATNTLLAGRDQENGLEPQVHSNVAGLENGANLHGKRLAAVVAFIQAKAGRFAAHALVALHAAAVGADRAMRPDTGLYELVGGFFIMKMGLGKDGFAHDWLLKVKPV